MADQIAIQLKFTAEIDGTIFRDALYFTEAEWAAIIPQEIADKKQQRIDNWLATVNENSQLDNSN